MSEIKFKDERTKRLAQLSLDIMESEFGEDLPQSYKKLKESLAEEKGLAFSAPSQDGVKIDRTANH